MSFFKDKTIVMSGGSRGVGLEIAKALGPGKKVVTFNCDSG